MLPVARRELLVLVKSPGFYYRRLGASITLLLCGAAFGTVYHYLDLNALRQVVSVFAFVAVAACLFLGAQLTSDSIAREKREGTLGLLFLTELRPSDIMAGKLVGNALPGLYGLLMILPFISLVVITGGMAPQDVTGIAVLALNAFFVSACTGLLVSSLRMDRRKASGTAAGVVLFLWWGLPLLADLADYLKAPAWCSQGFRLFALTNSAGITFGGPRVSAGVSPWLNFFCTHALGWLFLGVTVLRLPRGWQDRPAGTRWSLRAWWRKVALGTPEVRVRIRRALLDRNAFLWLAGRERFRALGIWIASGIIATMAFVSFIGSSYQVGVLAGFSLALCISHKALMCAAGSGRLLVEQEEGTLEMIFSTPLSAREILWGQFLAAVRPFYGPVLLALAMQIVTIVLLFREKGFAPAFGLMVYSATYLFDLFTAAWLAMWAAVIVRDAKQAPKAASARLFAVPALISALPLGALVSFGVDSPRSLLFPVLWFFVGWLSNVAWLLFLRRQLPDRLRTFALRRYADESPGVFAWLGRRLGTWVRQQRPAPLALSRG